MCKAINEIDRNTMVVSQTTNVNSGNSNSIKEIKELYDDIMEYRKKHADKYNDKNVIKDSCRLQLCYISAQYLSNATNREDEYMQTMLHNTCVIFGEIKEFQENQDSNNPECELYTTTIDVLKKLLNDKSQIKSILDDINNSNEDKSNINNAFLKELENKINELGG